MIVLSGLIWRRRFPRATWLAVAVLLPVGWLLVGPFEYEAKRVAGFALVTLCCSAGLALLDTQPRATSSSRSAWQVTLILGCTFIAAMMATDGFYLRNLRFDFALNWLAGAFDKEWATALVATIIASWKYFLGFAAAMLASCFTLGLGRTLQLGRWVALIAGFKVLMQAIQMTGVSFVEEEKMSELLLQELLGIYFITACLWATLIKLALCRYGWQWTLGKDRVP
jgi:hypothetical protein